MYTRHKRGTAFVCARMIRVYVLKHNTKYIIQIYYMYVFHTFTIFDNRNNNIIS